jgi:hypothetical protein
MAARKKELPPPDFDSVAEAAEFWDGHSLVDYEEYLKPAKLEFRLRRRVHLVAVDPAIALQLRAVSQARGLSPETVANLWLRERLAKELKRPRSHKRAA